MSNQIVKFLIIGILNTAIDFVVLNLLIFLFAPGKNTLLYILFKAVSFSIAVINSYYFNKYWVFRAQANLKFDFGYFFVVSLIGFLLNIAIASTIFYILIQIYPAHIQIIGNLGAIAGTIIILFWNFIGYKFFVFKA